MARSSAVGDVARAQKSVLLGVLLIAPVVYANGAMSPFGSPKVAALYVAGLLVLALEAAGALTGARTKRLTRWAKAVLAVFAIALIAASLVGTSKPVAVFGIHGRFTGLLPYLAGAACLFAAARVFSSRDVPQIAAVLAAAGTMVSLYAVLQGAGVLERFATPDGAEFGGVSATLGNPNFVSGFLAVTVSLTVWLGVATPRAAYRAAAAGMAVLQVVGLVLSASSQGLVAGAAGVGLVLLGRTLDWPAKTRIRAQLALAAGASVGLAGVAAGLAGAGPLRALGEQVSFQLRLWYWEAAVAMWQDLPLLGVGMDHYGSYYREYRPRPAVLASADLAAGNNAAHSVPLQMLAQGGIVLAAAYVFLIVFTAWALARALRGATGSMRFAVVGLGAAWVAYLVQSLVSIDAPVLLLIHFVLAGAIWSVSPLAVWSAPKQRSRPKRSSQSTVVAVCLGILACGIGLLPLVADLAAKGEGDATSRLAGLERAVRLAPWESTYRLEHARVLAEAGQLEASIASLEKAVALDPRNINAVITLARSLTGAGRPDAARSWYERALAIEPQHPDMKVEVARFESDQGNRERALGLLTEAIAVQPQHAAAAELRDELVPQ